MTVDHVQTSYSIYLGDDQRRYLSDQGPWQNDIVSQGLEPTALRNIFTEATNPAVILKLLEKAYGTIQESMSVDDRRGYGAVRFTGLIGMGDLFDLGCPAEVRSLIMSIAQYLGISPELVFRLLLPGNHDGGQYMGSIWSPRNFFGLINLGGKDYQEDICGPDPRISVEDRVEAFDCIVRQQEACSDQTRENVTVDIERGNGRIFSLENSNERIRFKDTEQAFQKLWTPTPELDRWDAVMHFNTDQENHEENGVRDWIHLQAFKQEEFELADGKTVPIYNIGLDTQDFTASPAFQGSVKGHVSAFQVSAVETFMDSKIQANPNAKFKISMHYPIESLVQSSKESVKRLLSREEVILVADGHEHRQRYDRDLRHVISLPSRKTPLARICVPSGIDNPRAMVTEKMIFSDGGEPGKYTVRFEFEFIGLEPEDIATPEGNPRVYAKLEEFRQGLLDQRCGYFGQGEWDQGREACSDGTEYDFIYSNAEALAERVPGDLRFVAESRESRCKQFARILRTLFSVKDQLMNRLTVLATIPQMSADFESYLVYLECVHELLVDEGRDDLAKTLRGKIVYMEAAKVLWEEEYSQVEERTGFKRRIAFNDLYTRAKLYDTVEFLNNNLPKDSDANLFSVIVGLESSEEDFMQYYGVEGVDSVSDSKHLREEMRSVLDPNTSDRESFSYRYEVVE